MSTTIQNSDNQAIDKEKAERFELLRKKLGLNQSDFGERIGTGQSHVAKYEKAKRTIGKNIEYKLLREFNVSPDWWRTGEGEIFNSGNANIVSDEIYVELTYIPQKARAGFTELQHTLNDPFETYRVLKNDLEGSIADQIVIEIDGDSMEPNYWTGSKVRCKVVPQGDWIYLNSGVYAVVYSNFFVVKRVKNSPQNGILMLHSDNTETGGNLEVPLSEVRRIWKVLRIVDAPAR